MLITTLRKIWNFFFSEVDTYWVVLYEIMTKDSVKITVELQKVSVIKSVRPPKFNSEFGVHRIDVLGPFYTLESANKYADIFAKGK